MDKEQALQMMQQLEVLEQQASELSATKSNLTSLLRESHLTLEAVKELGEKDDDSEALIPVGGGAFIKTKPSSKDNIVLYVGAGVYIEKDRESVLGFLEVRTKEVQTALQNTSSKLQETMARFEHGKRTIGDLQAGSASRRV